MRGAREEAASDEKQRGLENRLGLFSAPAFALNYMLATRKLMLVAGSGEWAVSGRQDSRWSIGEEPPVTLACCFHRCEFTPTARSQSCSGISASAEAAAMKGNI